MCLFLCANCVCVCVCVKTKTCQSDQFTKSRDTDVTVSITVTGCPANDDHRPILNDSSVSIRLAGQCCLYVRVLSTPRDGVLMSRSVVRD